MLNIPQAPGIALIESQMHDKCLVKRDRMGVHNEVLNEETWQLERPAGDDEIVFEGYFMMKTIRSVDREFTEAEAAKMINGYTCLLPKFPTSAKVLQGSPDAILPGDILVLTESRDHPDWEEAEFRVHSTELATNPVYKRIIIQQISPSPANPEF